MRERKEGRKEKKKEGRKEGRKEGEKDDVMDVEERGKNDGEREIAGREHEEWLKGRGEEGKARR